MVGEIATGILLGSSFIGAAPKVALLKATSCLSFLGVSSSLAKTGGVGGGKLAHGGIFCSKSAGTTATKSSSLGPGGTSGGGAGSNTALLDAGKNTAAATNIPGTVGATGIATTGAATAVGESVAAEEAKEVATQWMILPIVAYAATALTNLTDYMFSAEHENREDDMDEKKEETKNEEDEKVEDVTCDKENEDVISSLLNNYTSAEQLDICSDHTKMFVHV